MSYDLHFWRYKSGIDLDHQTVCETLMNGEAVDGLETLPVDEVKQRLNEVFTGAWQSVGDGTWERDAGGAFQLYTTPQFVCAHCYGMAGDDMNRIIDVLLEYDCPLYDPQTVERFGGG